MAKDKAIAEFTERVPSLESNWRSVADRSFKLRFPHHRY